VPSASHLTDGPRKAVTDIRDAEAEALRTALGISFLQVIESWLTAITVFPLDIVLQVIIKHELVKPMCPDRQKKTSFI
jgi:hypothetical protein